MSDAAVQAKTGKAWVEQLERLKGLLEA